MICIDHDDVLPTYERQLPSCPPWHKVNLQPDTGCALGGAGDSLSVLEQYSMPDAQIPWLYIQTCQVEQLVYHINSRLVYFFLQDMLRGERDKKQSCHMCCVCVGNLHLLVNTCK